MYIADLHIHSRYSRATSKDLTPEQLDFWAGRKGIQILGTGDFTHPAWRDELREKLVPAEDGLYRLKDELKIGGSGAAGSSAPSTRFVISGEISSIYKKNGKVRKVHSVILLPSLEDAELLSKKLETIGNIHSDGRPILGLDCRDLLEITLELCPRAIYIPAHIWTPHFSLFGAFSGFDTVEECYEDLTPHIHAMETGLSSDPPMNWRLSALDSYQLVSNSDAHSPAKLGREANLLDIEMCYDGLYGAIQRGDGLAGTIEFFPEEGKYHYDGHRKCHLCLSPTEAERYDGKCPVCGKKLTIGVSHRVEQLADRAEGYKPAGARPFESLVPLPEVIAASTGRSAASAKVQDQYAQMLAKLGPEFTILRELPVEEIRTAAGYQVSEGIRRLREGHVERLPGFDGEYGTIKLFTPSEIDNLDGQLSLFAGWSEMSAESDGGGTASGGAKGPSETAAAMVTDTGSTVSGSGAVTAAAMPGTSAAAMPGAPSAAMPGAVTPAAVPGASATVMPGAPSAAMPGAPSATMPAASSQALNPEQTRAVRSTNRVTAVIAGPGTGKTGTLAARIAYLIETRRVKAGEITAVTFTNKAAQEMLSRLESQLGSKQAVRRIQIGTFHSICYDILKKQGISFVMADETEMFEMAREAIQGQNLKLKPSRLLHYISLRKAGVSQAEAGLNRDEAAPSAEGEKNRNETALSTEGEKNRDEAAPSAQTEKNSAPLVTGEQLEAAYRAYQEALTAAGALDFDDLLLRALEIAEAGEACEPFRYLLVDEFQDINPVQYRLIRAWNRAGRELFVIGDPDQAIYGFRGTDAKCFLRLAEDEPELETIRLEQNYRSTPQILEGAMSVISVNPGPPRSLHANREDGFPIRIVNAASEMAEAIFVAKEINRQIGGIDMLDAQEGFACPDDRRPRSFADIAVLYRTHRQADLLEKCLQKEGIPYVVAGRDDFLRADSVRGTICFLRCLMDGQDELSRRLCLKLLWNLSEDCISDCIFQAMADKYSPQLKKVRPQKLLAVWMGDMGLEGDADMQKLASAAVFYKSVREFLDSLSFGQESDLRRCGKKNYTSDAVTLMTLHGSKGLEFPVVLLYGARKGMIPLETGKQISDMEEERRLFFVGMTRAKEELILTTGREPSPFLEDIPESVMVRQQANPNHRADAGQQLSLFDFM